MKQSLFLVLFGVLSLSAETVEARKFDCAAKIAATGFRLVGGASWHEHQGLRRGNYVTNLLGNESVAGSKNRRFDFELRDGTASRGQALGSGRLLFNESTDEILGVSLDPTPRRSGVHDPVTLEAIAKDAALSLFNLNRPDIGAFTEVLSAKYAIPDFRPGPKRIWYSVKIRDFHRPDEIFDVMVSLDPQSVAPISEVRIGAWESDQHQGLARVASAAARLVGGVNMPVMRRGNIISDFGRGGYRRPNAEINLLDGTNSGGRPLSVARVEFRNPERAEIGAVSITPQMQGAINWPVDLQKMMTTEAALALHNLNRSDANERTRVVEPRPGREGRLQGRRVLWHTVEIQEGEGRSKRSFLYNVAFDEQSLQPILRVESVEAAN